MPSIQILLATYNGELFLQEQLDSLFAQTQQDFEILVADDGSVDGTVRLLEASVACYPGRIRILSRERVGGVTRNFMRLIDAADADYVLCCDQDDVWMPNKVAALVGRSRSAETKSPGAPVLVHSDLAVVDEELHILYSSMFAFQKMRPANATFRLLLLQSNVTGCAMLLNRCLVDLMKGSDPDRMVMHDWWASLLAAAFGRIEFVREPVVLYRQHGSNMQGVSGWGLRRAWARTWIALNGANPTNLLGPCAMQASALVDQYGARLLLAERRLACIAARLVTQPRLIASYNMLRHRLLCGGLVRNLAKLLRPVRPLANDTMRADRTAGSGSARGEQ